MSTQTETVAALRSVGAAVPRGDVTAKLVFYEPPADGAVPFNYVEEPPAGEPRSNYGSNEQPVTIKDVRGHEGEYSLERNAFAAVQGYPHNEAINWEDDASIKQHYYPEVERLLLDQVKGANRVLLFDHTIRRPGTNRTAVNRTHIDQTAKAARMRVEHHLPDEAERLQRGRYWIINVWRPLNGAVESNPLSFADSTSVGPDDIIAVEHRYPDRTGETAGVKHNSAQQWHYWSGMTNDERLLLQCFDSRNLTTRLPHSAFEDPRSTPDSKPRHSIEVRALVFGD